MQGLRLHGLSPSFAGAVGGAEQGWQVASSLTGNGKLAEGHQGREKGHTLQTASRMRETERGRECGQTHHPPASRETNRTTRTPETELTAGKKAGAPLAPHGPRP